jgi:hypothetical protein
VPPIFQPELMATAVLHAIEHPARELWVGWPAIEAILGQRIAPGLLDRYLARAAWDAQQTDALRHHHRDTLDAPLPGDRGAHGEFGGAARSWSLALWLRRRRALVAAAAVVAAALGARALRHA